MKPLHDASGFSTLATLVTLSAIILVAYTSLGAQVTVAKTHRDIESNLEITAFTGRLRSILDTQWSCTASLSGQNYTGPITLKDPINSATPIATAGTTTVALWNLARLSLQNVAPVAGRPGVLQGELDLTFNKDMRYQVGAPSVTQSIQGVSFATDGSGNITQCYPSTAALATAQAACSVISGTWNAAAPYGSQCTRTAANPAPGPAGVCGDPQAGFIGLPSSSLAISGNGSAASNLYLLNSSKLTLSGNARITGELFEGTGASYTKSGNAGVAAVAQADLTALAQSLNAFVAAESALAATQELTGIGGTAILVGNGQQNVIQVTGDLALTGNSTLTLSGSAQDRFVINVLGKITVSGNASILLAGGVLPQNVLFNNLGTGNEIVISGNGSVSGTFIGLQRGLQVSGNGSIAGAFVAGGGVGSKITISGNGLAMHPYPYCVR